MFFRLVVVLAIAGVYRKEVKDLVSTVYDIEI